jgi:hypothetical protein
VITPYRIIIKRIDIREVRVDAEEIKKLEIKLKKMFEQSQVEKEQSKAILGTDDIIRRRKAKPDKRISHKKR